MIPFRRKIALLICPELDVDLRAKHLPDLDEALTPLQDGGHILADEIRKLERLLRERTGEPLVWSQFKQVRGKPAIVGSMCEGDAYDALQVIKRLARNPYSGCGDRSYDIARSLLSFAWPDDLNWPDYIARPTPKGEDLQ